MKTFTAILRFTWEKKVWRCSRRLISSPLAFLDQNKTLNKYNVRFKIRLSGKNNNQQEGKKFLDTGLLFISTRKALLKTSPRKFPQVQVKVFHQTDLWLISMVPSQNCGHKTLVSYPSDLKKTKMIGKIIWILS